jgi:hypothetical protein
MHVIDQFAAGTRSACARFVGDSRLADIDLVIEQRIADADEVVSNYHVCIANGEVDVIDGPAEAPDVTISQDLATAQALQRGDVHAQTAFLTGRLNIDGDIHKLLDHGELLANLLGGHRDVTGAQSGDADA